MIVAKKQPPCFECHDRVFGCHAVCKRYKAYHESREEMARLIREQKHKEDLFYGYVCDKADKIKKRNKKW